ncbi:hypothetical protein [Streptomyces sp. NPDC004296]|uniref:hypothetical protein n=1 Tax=Streptomyces sp. NPDC004296 TaxID=3364697 RepID=UPI0036C024D9
MKRIQNGHSEGSGKNRTGTLAIAGSTLRDTEAKDRPARARRSYTRAAAPLLAVCVLAGVPACSSDSSKTPPAPSTIQPTKTPNTTETAKKEAIATYQAYWKEMEKLYADRSGASASLQQYAASAALKNAESDAKRAHDRGLLLIGNVTVSDSTAAKVVTKSKLDYAVISSCLDISKWETVNADTKKPVTLPSNRLTKYVIQSTIERWPEGWRVTRDEPQDKRC